MGAAASKATRKLPVHNAAKRLQQEIPSSVPVSNFAVRMQADSAATTIRRNPVLLDVKTDDKAHDSQDPHFSSMLRSLGAVAHTNSPQSQMTTRYPSPAPPSFFSDPSTAPFSPSSLISPSSRSNTPKNIPTSVLILRCRAEHAERAASNPRSYLDVFTIRDVTMLREGVAVPGRRKMADEKVEKMLGLEDGILQRLGNKVGHVGVSETSREDEIEFLG